MRLDHLLSKEMRSSLRGRAKDGQSLIPLIIYGGVAQLGEHLPCKQGVKSSNLSISTAGELNENES